MVRCDRTGVSRERTGFALHLEESIIIRRPPARIWSFLGDVGNIPRWDRGVTAVVHAPSGVTGVGSEFETVACSSRPAPGSRGRMAYRIIEADPVRQCCTVALTNRDGNARFFRTAAWTFRTQSAPEGTLLTCSADFVLRRRWCFLAPIFLLMRGAITRDLRQLRDVIEAE